MVRRRGSLEAGLSLVHLPDGDFGAHVQVLKQQLLMKRLGLVPPSYHLTIDRQSVNEMESNFRFIYNIGRQMPLMEALDLALKMVKHRLDLLGIKVDLDSPYFGNVSWFLYLFYRRQKFQ